MSSRYLPRSPVELFEGLEDTLLFRRAVRRAGLGEELQRRLTDRAGAEDVPRNAVAAGEANRVGERAADLQRVLDALDAEVAALRVVEAGVVVRAVAVVVPGVADVALQADHDAIVLVFEVGSPRPAFDVAAAELHRNERARACSGAAEGRRFLRAHQGVVAVDVDVAAIEPAAAEGAGGRDVAERAVVHEHELGVGLRPRRDLVVREEAREIAVVVARQVLSARLQAEPPAAPEPAAGRGWRP